MIGTLETWRWAVSDDAAPLREALAGEPSLNRLAKLRERWTPDQIAVTSELLASRRKAATNFPDHASRIIADREGLEMASSARAADHKAARFRQHLPDTAPVIDACCGIGGDTMSLARTGLDITAIDLDERRAWMAGANAGCDHRAADIREIDTGDAAIHIDPARRAAGSRTRDAEAFDPPLSDIEQLIARAPLAAIKLNPGIRADQLPPGELEIISERGTLTQAVLWTGLADASERRATLLDADRVTHSIAGDPTRPDDSNPLARFIFTMDPSLERADLVPALLESMPLRCVHPGTGLLTADQPHDSAWTTAFEVLGEFPWQPKRARAALRSLDAGIVTVKTRAGVVDPDTVSKQLRGTGNRPLTVFILPIADRARCIITERTQ